MSIEGGYSRIRLDGRVIIVTGGGSGIGQETAKLMAMRGAAVAVADIDDIGGENTVAEIVNAGGRALYQHVDVADEAQVSAMVANTVATFGGLHGAFNNAGMLSLGGAIAGQDLADWQRLIAVNLNGIFLCMKHEIAYLERNGGGAIVNTTSVAGLVGVPNVADYVASKHGVVGLTRAAAIDYGARGIRINCIAPGATETPMMRQSLADPAIATRIAAGHPIGRVGHAYELAEAAAWLLSDAASYITGVCLPVDGGYTAI